MEGRMIREEIQHARSLVETMIGKAESEAIDELKTVKDKLVEAEEWLARAEKIDENVTAPAGTTVAGDGGSEANA
jgi:hypothetical protein